MIELMMFLLLAGGQKSAPTACMFAGECVRCSQACVTSLPKMVKKPTRKNKFDHARDGLWGAGDDTEKPNQVTNTYSNHPALLGGIPVFAEDPPLKYTLSTDSTFTPAVIIRTKDVTAVKLADSEYAHLQDLRKAVADEEKRLAVDYGAVLENPQPCPPNCATFGGAYVWKPDHYEYHGQFLLIEKDK